MANTKKCAEGGEVSPDEIVADIERKQNEEDKDLIPRAGRMLKAKLKEDLTGGAYVGSRLNMPSNTRMGKLNAKDTALLNKYDTSPEGEKASVTRERAKFGMKKGGSVSSASSRADGCAIKGKTKGRII
jgi:hypothetical protein